MILAGFALIVLWAWAALLYVLGAAVWMLGANSS